MITIDSIARRNNEWIRVAMFYGCPQDVAPDVVQDVYIALMNIERRDGNLNRITHDGKLNDAYMFTAIRNTIDKRVFREKKRTPVFFYGLQINGAMLKQESFIDTIEREHEFVDLVCDCERVLNSLDWYDRDLFKAYIKEGSIRKLHKATGISTRCIHKTLIKVRTLIQQQIKYEKTNSSKRNGRNHNDGRSINVDTPEEKERRRNVDQRLETKIVKIDTQDENADIGFDRRNKFAGRG